MLVMELGVRNSPYTNNVKFKKKNQFHDSDYTSPFTEIKLSWVYTNNNQQS